MSKPPTTTPSRKIYNLGNLYKTFLYTQLAVKTGSLEGAINTYSRRLISISGYERVQYEPAVLYFRLKSCQLSKSYIFIAVLANKGMPPGICKRMAILINAIDEQLVQNRFSGSLSAGVPDLPPLRYLPVRNPASHTGLRFDFTDH